MNYKAKDLFFPFNWENRRVYLKNKILYIPDYYDSLEEFTHPGWEALFGNSNPVIVEYCSGNGDWVVEQALAHPEKNWVAVEMQFRRVRKIWAKQKNRKIENLFIICGEAYIATKHYFPDASISASYLNFPDPWPKNKHAKHRLIHRPFLDELHRALIKEAPFTFASDDLPYTNHFINEIKAHEGFEAPNVTTDWPGYGGSWFDTLWKRLGRDIHYVHSIKNY